MELKHKTSLRSQSNLGHRDKQAAHPPLRHAARPHSHRGQHCRNHTDLWNSSRARVHGPLTLCTLLGTHREGKVTLEPCPQLPTQRGSETKCEA